MESTINQLTPAKIMQIGSCFWPSKILLIETGEGFDHTFDDYNRWIHKIGSKSTKTVPLGGPASAAIAFKLKIKSLIIQSYTEDV